MRRRSTKASTSDPLREQRHAAETLIPRRSAITCTRVRLRMDGSGWPQSDVTVTMIDRVSIAVR
jgi:hypothetical protein